MKLHHFRDVVAIAERGSLRAAARYLKLAQPALTRSLGELERELGTPLFERQARGMIPTPMGRTFIERACAILHEVRRAQEDIEQQQGGVQGSVTVGLSIAPHIAVLPKALAAFRARYPGVRLHVIEGFYTTLESGLKDGSVDFFIGPAPGVPVSAGLAQDKLAANLRVVLCRQGHPLASAGSLAELTGAEWATNSITLRAEEEMGELFERHHLPQPRLALRSQSALTLLVTLTHSDLLAMVPVQWLQFAPVRESLTHIPVREILPAPDIVLIRRAGAALTPAAIFLLELMCNATREGGLLNGR
jgi:DNA-binding transcriptional LysR family regulator